MNPETFDTQLDRLVDGELHGAEYREFVAMLDRDPQHWRRCALAFLEAQALRGDLHVLREQHLAPHVSRDDTHVAPAAQTSATESRVSWWHIALAMAASFVIALPLGSALGRLLRSSDAPAVAVDSPREHDEDLPTSGLITQSQDTPHEPLGNVQFVDADGRVLELPYYDLASHPEHLTASDSGLPLELLQTLERTGHRIERQTGIVPVNLGNGSQAIMPAEHYRITPANHRAYQ
jgi:hypothetical protein